MGFPNSVSKADPADTDNPSAGAAQIRNLKIFLEDLLGIQDAVSYTAAPFAIGTAGQVTVAQPRMLLQNGNPTTPSFGFAGATSIGVQYDSVNTALGIVVGSTQMSRFEQSRLTVNALNVLTGGSITPSTGVAQILMTTANGATNASWIPIQYAGTTYYVPGFTTHAP
jgi:hypothetical protein